MSPLPKLENHWEKLGLFIKPRTDLWWMRTHAMIPTIEPLDGSHFKIYFSGRNDSNISHIGYAIADFSSEQPKIVDFSTEPVLCPGELGCFDDNGVTPSSVVSSNGRLFLYYIGWNPGSTVRMNLFGGLAISEDQGKSFHRYSRAPIIERTRNDPFLNTAPHVIQENGLWRMYYVAGVGWKHKDLPRYHIRYAESSDGMNWRRDGKICIDFRDENETSLARPYVLKEEGIYKMWFSCKGLNYRLGYAESADGINWSRNDSAVGISNGMTGVDSEMIEYASVFRCNGRKFMLYNGNNYGKDGIALAISSAP